MAESRRIIPLIFYDGQEIGLTKRLESLDYTDNDQGQSDEVELTFAGNSATWLQMNTEIEKEHNIEVALTFTQWKSPGNFDNYHVGNFTVDDITFSGPPSVSVIKGISLPASTGFQTVKKSQTWNNVSIKQIAMEKMAEYAMANLFYNAEETILEVVEQADQTDSEFLYDLCKQQGLFLKIYKTGLVIFDKKVYESRGVKTTFRQKDIESYSWNSTLVGTYTGATIAYTNPEAAKNTSVAKKDAAAQKAANAQYNVTNSYNAGKIDPAANNKMITVTVGEGPRILQINEHCENEYEARAKAVAKLNEENEKAVTIEFTTILNSDAYLNATNNFQIEDMGRMDGKYFCTSVTHSFSGSGHQMTVKGYKIFNRL